MKTQKLFVLCLALACISSVFVDAKTVFRRKDKISENFKQIGLTADEIDPNVAPPEPQKVETIDPADAASVASIMGTGTAVTGAAEEVIDEADEVVNEAANEVANVASPVTPAAAGAAPAAATVAAPAAPAASGASSTSAVTSAASEAAATNPISKFCKCSENSCDCCRTFRLPLIPVRGPGCAKITYLGKEKMSVAIKYGDVTLASRTISGKKAKPICVGLPGGYSKFCGRVYGLSKAKSDFKACLGFELRADDEVEAALRVSCFKFGPDGMRVADAEPLPSEVNKEEEDDDDIFGFGAGGDDDEDDYDADDTDDEEDETADEEEEENDDDEVPADVDYGGFSLGGLLDELGDDDDDATKPSATKPAASVPAAVGQTRTVAQHSGKAHGKDDGVTTLNESDGHTHNQATEAVIAAEEAALAAAAVTTATPVDGIAEAATTIKTKTKKSKKNKKKKKKAATSTETDLAFEIINGILDFFN